MVEISKPLNVIGDIHGQFYDLMQIFYNVGRPPDYKFLFLGDIVDRGMQSIETASLICLLKILYKD